MLYELLHDVLAPRRDALSVVAAEADLVSDDPPIPELPSGQVDIFPGPQAPTGFDGVHAVLWIPDPEQRHGWREYYVRTPELPKPGARFGY